jgi:molecular chaperone HscB
MTSADYFEFLKLPRSLAIDSKDLEKRFYALSRKYHPDVHARKSQAEKDLAEESAAVLNDAYRTLRDPIQRAQYLLKLEGFDIGEQSTKGVPPELLEEVFELNEAIEESGKGEALEPFRQKFQSMRGEIDAELQDKFEEWDGAHDRQTLSAVRGLLNRRKYIANLIAQTNVPD